MKTQGQIEAMACDVVNHFLRSMLGRGPGKISATLRGNVLFVQLEDVLTTAERTLVVGDKTAPERSIEMVRQHRDYLVQHSRNELLAALSESLGQQVGGIMHDIDPVTGSEVLVFQLSEGLESVRRST